RTSFPTAIQAPLQIAPTSLYLYITIPKLNLLYKMENVCRTTESHCIPEKLDFLLETDIMKIVGPILDGTITKKGE
uniref:Uncharacterized protein n=1 Tax=Romanomermis culicivorax TaxID=13658 RepID=A0A915HDW7_ROMCU